MHISLRSAIAVSHSWTFELTSGETLSLGSRPLLIRQCGWRSHSKFPKAAEASSANAGCREDIVTYQSEAYWRLFGRSDRLKDQGG